MHDFKSLKLASTKGLDDAISAAEHVIGDPFQRASGALIFATSAEANYLANSLNADMTCVNFFPPELLVGSKWARPIKVNIQSVSSGLCRYPRELFEEERIVFLGSSPVSRLLQDDRIDVGDTKNGARRLGAWLEAAEMPLKPTGQGMGRRMDFFEAALLTSLLTVVLPVLLSLGLIVRSLYGSVTSG